MSTCTGSQTGVLTSINEKTWMGQEQESRRHTRSAGGLAAKRELERGKQNAGYACMRVTE
jgi:hypothetical protein